jgi:hypothetical protein
VRSALPIKISKGVVMSAQTVMPGSMSVGWKCSTCGQLITRIEDGWVEWLAFEDQERTGHLGGLRLVHRLAVFFKKRGAQACRYDARRQFRKDRSIVEGLPLDRFVGPDGLMLLLSFIAAGEMPVGEILELAKRVQIPGYELVRDLKRQMTYKVSVPSIGDGYYLQSEIQAVLASYEESRAS